MLEALCPCGEVFNPHDEDDTIHIWSELRGEHCGQQGQIVAEWTR